MNRHNAGSSIWLGLYEALSCIRTDKPFVKQYEFKIEVRNVLKGCKIGEESGYYAISRTIYPACTCRCRTKADKIYDAFLKHCGAVDVKAEGGAK